MKPMNDLGHALRSAAIIAGIVQPDGTFENLGGLRQGPEADAVRHQLRLHDERLRALRSHYWVTAGVDSWTLGRGEAELAQFADREDAIRAKEALNAVHGIETADLELMNAKERGALSAAYDACSSIVESLGFAALDYDDGQMDSDVDPGECWDALDECSGLIVKAVAHRR